MKILSWIITLPILLAVVAFALENRTPVTLDLWPFNLSLSLPLSVLTLGMLFLGIFLGSFMSWISSLRLRMQIRKLKKEIATMESLNSRPLPENRIIENAPEKITFISRLKSLGERK